MKPTKWTADKIRALKDNGKVVCLTAYDCTTARYADAAGITLILVGDSLATTVLGYSSTIPVTVRQMLHHTAAVTRGVSSAMVIADMPFMSYQVSPERALINASRFIKEAGANGVKLEGGQLRADAINMITRNGIPVLGHIGLTPQNVLQTGGYKVQGTTDAAIEQLVEDARAIEKAGAFALVIECVPRHVGALITQTVRIPTIGIGAGPDCDGQILVSHDLLGLSGPKVPRFVKCYTNLGSQVATAFSDFRKDVESGTFPADEHCYG
jgi:3-methyl-2-oxobutanoate hydroxymethyltransferase